MSSVLENRQKAGGIDTSKVLEIFTERRAASEGQRLIESVEHTNRAFDKTLERGLDHWIIMYSGGKDSTTTLLLALEYARSNKNIRQIDVIYSDTQVEIPTIHSYAYRFLDMLAMPQVNLRIHKVKPEPEKSFWTLVIGKGYPPPHQKFRWCTSKMKIQPAEKVTREVMTPTKTAIMTGVRFGESDVRDK